MGELRLYAIGIGEFRGMFGAPPELANRLRELARDAYTPAQPVGQRGGLLSRLGPMFKRPPDAPVISPTQPEPQDVEVLLAGSYVPHERTGATWRLLETLTSGLAWGSTKLPLDAHALDDLDFVLARGGVSAAVGLRHLLNCGTAVPLLPVEGLTIGWHPHDTALAMASAYRDALDEIRSAEQRELVAGLIVWLDGFRAWPDIAAQLGRPIPDLVGFWAN